MQMSCKAKYGCRYFIFINRNLSKIFVLPDVKALKIKNTKPFVRYYQIIFVKFGQMVYQKQVFPLEKPAHFYIRMRARLSVLRSFVPIARIAFSMSVKYDEMGKLKKVLIFVSPRHIVWCAATTRTWCHAGCTS